MAQFKIAILIVGIAVYGCPNLLLAQVTTIVKDKVDKGNKSYTATKYIEFSSGYLFEAKASESMTATIEVPQPKVTCINPTVLISLSKIYVKIKKDNSFDDEFCFLSASYFNDDCGGSPVYDFVTPLLKKIANSDLKKWLTIDRPIGKLCKNSNIAIVFFDYDDWASNPKTWQFDPICKNFHSVKTLNEFYGTIILKYSDFENLQPGAEKTFSLPGADITFKLF